MTLKTNFQHVRDLFAASHESRRSLASAKRIAAACQALNFSKSETFLMFAYLEYCDRNTGHAFPYKRGRSLIAGQVFWDFQAYQDAGAARLLAAIHGETKPS